MAIQTILVGTIPNDGTGDTIRNGGIKINANFVELYSGLFSVPCNALPLVNGLNSSIVNYGFWNRITGPTAAFSVGGLSTSTLNAGAPADGMTVQLYNSTSQTMTIVNEDSGTTVLAQRIKTLTGANLVLATSAPSVVTLQYCAIETTPGPRWIVISHYP